MPLESAPLADRIKNRQQPRASSLYTPGLRVAVVDVLVGLVRHARGCLRRSRRRWTCIIGALRVQHLGVRGVSTKKKRNGSLEHLVVVIIFGVLVGRHDAFGAVRGVSTVVCDVLDVFEV